MISKIVSLIGGICSAPFLFHPIRPSLSSGPNPQRQANPGQGGRSFSRKIEQGHHDHVASEAFVLSLVSTLIGGIMGVGLSLFFANKGLDIRLFVPGDAAVSVSGIAFDPVWLATITLKTVLSPVLMMWVISLLASLYPAAIAARLDTVKAMTRV